MGGGGHRGSGDGGGGAGPDFKGLGALMDKHGQAVGVGQTEGGRASEEGGLRRIVNHVEDRGRPRERGEVNGHVVRGAQACAGGVDNDGVGGNRRGRIGGPEAVERNADSERGKVG